MAKKRIQEYISEYMDQFGKDNGYELSRCEFVKEGPLWFLRVFVDRIIDGKYDYMTSDDCEKVSRYLSSRLDEDDPIEQNYYLEVSSPGLDRPLLSDKDFIRFNGSEVEVKLYEAINNSKKLSGVLKSYKDGVMGIELENGEVLELAKEKVAKVNLAVII